MLTRVLTVKSNYTANMPTYNLTITQSQLDIVLTKSQLGNVLTYDLTARCANIQSHGYT